MRISVAFRRYLRRVSLKRLIFGETRTFSILLVGGIVYLLLFIIFEGRNVLSRGTPARFPRKVWQSWKYDALSFEDREAVRARSWLIKNPTFRHEVLTDTSGIAYVEEIFGSFGFNRPDIVKVFKALNARIVQADLLRYIIMYAEGGIWADVDVEALQSFDRFIPADRYSESDLGMIIGVETDEPKFRHHHILGGKACSFCQWAFVCKPRQPIMLKLIDSIIVWLKTLAAQQNKEISELSLSFDEVLSGTGPSAFTAAILSQMSHSTGRNVTWDDFHGLRESKVVGNILVLPAEAFAAGTLHSRSGNHQSAGALVKHHFHASEWTTSHVRFKHPIYGEIERCNWDPECVELWDANTAFFDALPKEDQLRMISTKKSKEATAKEAMEVAIQIQAEAQVPLIAAEAQVEAQEVIAAMDEMQQLYDQARDSQKDVEGATADAGPRDEVK